MPRFFVDSSNIENDIIKITGQDVNHIKNVLRKSVGDSLEVCNKDTQADFICEISNIAETCIDCCITKKLENNAESNVYINVFQGLPKADKMELIIQKSVELGACEITPVEMKRCVAKIDGKDEAKKLQRWQKISEVAAKQCGRNIVPKINNLTNVKNICNLCKNYDIVLVAYENERENTLKAELKKLDKQNLKIAIVIGPEGGLEPDDVAYLKENGAKVITLGKRILRTETVALNMISVIMYELECDAN